MLDASRWDDPEFLKMSEASAWAADIRGCHRMFIVWGTKVRNEDLGVRADFCDCCLLVTRFKVVSVQHSGHIYYIPLGYTERGRYGECLICGAMKSESTAAVVVDHSDELDLPIDQLIDQTNPTLREVLPKIADEIEQSVPLAKRPLFLMSRFCALHEAKFAEAESSVGGWVGLVLIVLSLGVIAVFLNAHPYVGIAAAVAALVILLIFRNWIIQRTVAKQLMPRLKSYLQANGFSMDQLCHLMSSGEIVSKRLSKHLAHSRYDSIRSGYVDSAQQRQPSYLQPVTLPRNRERI